MEALRQKELCWRTMLLPEVLHVGFQLHSSLICTTTAGKSVSPQTTKTWSLLYFPFRPAEDALHLPVRAGREEPDLHTAGSERWYPPRLGSGAGPLWESPQWAPGPAREGLQLWGADGSCLSDLSALQVWHTLTYSRYIYELYPDFPQVTWRKCLFHLCRSMDYHRFSLPSADLNPHTPAHQPPHPLALPELNSQQHVFYNHPHQQGSVADWSQYPLFSYSSWWPLTQCTA